MKFKLDHKISVIQERFFVFFTLLPGPDITRSGSCSDPRFVHPWSKKISNIVITWVETNRCLKQLLCISDQTSAHSLQHSDPELPLVYQMSDRIDRPMN